MFNKMAKTGLAILMLGSASLGLTTIASAHTVDHHAKTKTTKHMKMAEFMYSHANLEGVGGTKVHGTAMFTLDTKTDTMTVVLKVWGLEKNSKHMAHVHAYKDGKAGAILYPLPAVDANAKGYAMVMHVYKGVKSLDNGGWIVNVHESMTNFKVISDGVVMAGK